MSEIVEVGDKPQVKRRAVAQGRLLLQAKTLAAVKAGKIPKGDPMAAAELAALMAVKATPTILPYCHPLPLTGSKAELTLEPEGVACRVTVTATYRTGVEMEALTGVAAGLLCFWDMVKFMEKDAKGQYPATRIEGIYVVDKTKEAA